MSVSIVPCSGLTGNPQLLLIRQRTESAGELTEAALQMALPGNLVDEDESLDAAASGS